MNFLFLKGQGILSCLASSHPNLAHRSLCALPPMSLAAFSLLVLAQSMAALAMPHIFKLDITSNVSFIQQHIHPQAILPPHTHLDFMASSFRIPELVSPRRWSLLSPTSRSFQKALEKELELMMERFPKAAPKDLKRFLMGNGMKAEKAIPAYAAHLKW